MLLLVLACMFGGNAQNATKAGRLKSMNEIGGESPEVAAIALLNSKINKKERL